MTANAKKFALKRLKNEKRLFLLFSRKEAEIKGI